VKWLEVNGNAYIKSGHDPEGEVARKFGVYGVPETFVIDRNGRIVHRHTGPISVREWAHVFRPLIQRLQADPD
jgi:cytochrome c biogenesis protein CcmG/thiol:disulfide interchange protein DsbE